MANLWVDENGLVEQKKMMLMMIKINKYWSNLVLEEARGHGAVCTREGVALRDERSAPPSLGRSQTL